MLQRLLELINQKGLRSQVELAQEMGLSPMLVGVMAEQLVRQGYLIDISKHSCQVGGCSGCSEGVLCSNTVGFSAVWVLTDKGKKIVTPKI